MTAQTLTARLWQSTTCFLFLFCPSPRVSGFVWLSRVPSQPSVKKLSYSTFRTIASVEKQQQVQRQSSPVLAMAEVASYPRGGKPVGEIKMPKPRLWIYDHCPFCVRARMILGFKGIPHHLMYLSNDDVETPTAMVGKKMVPILELGRRGSDDHEVMPESLDIVRRLDEDPAFGSPVLAPAACRTDIDDWISSIAMQQRRLLRPRHAAAPLPEFQTQSSREAFIRNHPLSDPSSYEDNLKMSPKLIDELEQALWKLEAMIGSDNSVSPDGKLSYDDINLWPRLRALTIVRGLGIPPKIRAYLEYLSESCDIPL